MSKHTPGPWSVGGKYKNPTVLVNAKGESIASGGNNRAVVGEELEASLRLAAASPELLVIATLVANLGEYASLIESMAELLRPHERAGFIRLFEDARAAVAKATRP